VSTSPRSGAGFRVVVREEDATITGDVLTPVESDESPDADQTDLNPPESWRRFTQKLPAPTKSGTASKVLLLSRFCKRY
jgi:hypothetical protein